MNRPLVWWLAGSVLGAGAVLVSAGQQTGHEAVSALGPLAWAALAGAAAVLATRGLARRLVGVVVAACGLGILVGAWSASGGAWRGIALAGGALLICAGVVAVAFSGGWPGMSGRYERSGSRTRPGTPVGERAMWDAIDDGDDPTA